MLRIATKWVLLLLLALFVASLTRVGGAAIGVVPFGWVKFLARTLPNVTVNWSGIGMVALCSALVLLTLQLFLQWLYAAMSPRSTSPYRPATWSWRWTVAVYACFWILFAIVIGASGAMRHTLWLTQFTEPVYKPRRNGYVELRVASGEAQMALLESRGEIQKAQALLLSFRPHGAGAWEHHQFLFFTNRDQHIDVVIVPRDPDLQRKTGFVLLGERGEERLPINEIASVLSRVQH